MPIPDFDVHGNLPPGEHQVSWAEFVAKFGHNDHRTAILDSIAAWLVHIQAAGCRTAWIDGSFVCEKEFPADFDACWDVTGVDAGLIDPVLLDISSIKGMSAIRSLYGGDIRPDRASPPASIVSYLQFFQRDRLRRPKGIIRLDVRGLSL